MCAYCNNGDEYLMNDCRYFYFVTSVWDSISNNLLEPCFSTGDIHNQIISNLHETCIQDEDNWSTTLVVVVDGLWRKQNECVFENVVSHISLLSV